MFEQLAVTRESIDERQVVALAGEVDLAAVPRVKSAVADVVEAGCRRLVIDLTETSFIDSTGLSALVAAQRRMIAIGGQLALVSDDGQIAHTLSLTGLDEVFMIHSTRESALDAMDDAQGADPDD